MSITNSDPNWPGWITGIVSVAALGWAFVKRFLATVTRKELEATLQRLHRENSDRLDSINKTVTSTHQRIDLLYHDMVRRQ